MKLIIIDNNGNSHLLFNKLEQEVDPNEVGNTVLDFVSFIEIECGSGVGRG